MRSKNCAKGSVSNPNDQKLDEIKEDWLKELLVRDAKSEDVVERFHIRLENKNL